MKATPSTIGKKYHITYLVVTITPLPHKKSTVQGYFAKLKWSKNSQQKWILYTLLSWKNMNVIKPTTSRKIRWVGDLNLFKKGYMCILRSGSVFWHFVKLWVIEWEELIIKDMAMHTIVLLLEAAGNVNRKAKVFHAMHNWILNGLLMTLAGASQQHCCVFYTHKYISIRLGSCMYVLLTSEL